MPIRRPRAGHPATSEAVEPTHRHEWAACVYLGTTGPTDAFREYPSIDHYWCPQGNVGLPTLIQRYGSGPHQYLAMPGQGLSSQAQPLAPDLCDGPAAGSHWARGLSAAQLGGCSQRSAAHTCSIMVPW